jgi:hypothetical protein
MQGLNVPLSAEFPVRDTITRVIDSQMVSTRAATGDHRHLKRPARHVGTE